MFRTPFESGDDPVYLGMTRVLPGGGFMDTDKGQIGLPEWMMASGPILIAAEIFNNRVSFTGKDIVDKTDTVPEKAQKRMEYLWRSVAPNAPWIPGSWDWQRMSQALSDEVDIFGHEYPVEIAAIRLFGPKVYPFDVEAQHSMRMMQLRKELGEYKRKIWELNTNRARNRIGEAAYERGVVSIQTGIERLAEREAALRGE